MKRLLQILTLSLGLAVVLAPTASAAGLQNISGTLSGNVTYWNTNRIVTNPSTSGWDVAFRYDAGIPPSMRMGAWNCAAQAFPWGGPYYQSMGSWSQVVPHLAIASGTRFCLATQDPTLHGGSFNGLLEWD